MAGMEFGKRPYAMFGPRHRGPSGACQAAVLVLQLCMEAVVHVGLFICPIASYRPT